MRLAIVPYADFAKGLCFTFILGCFWLNGMDASTEDVQALVATARVNPQANAHMQALLKANPTPSRLDLMAAQVTVHELLSPDPSAVRHTAGVAAQAARWLRALWPFIGVVLLASAGFAWCLEKWRGS
jgi:hypothetical protein